MSSILRKRRPTVSGTGIGPSSCTNPGYYRGPNLMTFHSKKTAVRRRNENAFGHRKRIIRCLSSSQVVFRLHQCAHQTLRRAFISNRATAPLMYPSQQSKDVEEKLGDLIPWLIRLKDSVATVNASDNHEEARRYEQLIRFVSRPYCLGSFD